MGAADVGSNFWFTITLQIDLDARAQNFIIEERLRGSRVLVVDDNATNRTILHEQVVAWGMRNGSAANGLQALELLRDAAAMNDPYDLALIDMLMPGMDGIELARAVKSDPALVRTQLIMLTSLGAAGESRTARAAGVSRYLSKPVRESDLFDAINDLLSGHRRDGDNHLPVPPAAPATIVSPRAAAPGVASSGGESAAQGRRRILLAEDNSVNQQVALAMLQQCNVEVDVAGDGSQAVQAHARGGYALILMDCHMPVMDGFEAMLKIREIEQAAADAAIAANGEVRPRTLVIAVTANALQGDRERCIAAGFDDYLAKPYRMLDLKKVVEDWLK